MATHLPCSDSYLTVWKDIVKITSSPLLQAERSLLAEFLEIFIIPTHNPIRTGGGRIPPLEKWQHICLVLILI